jgi:glucose/arabinose dehydrogenase
LLAVFVLGKPASGATNLSEGFEQSQVATGFTRPTAMEFAPDGRLFVAEKVGRLRVIDDNGELQTFVDISGQVSSRGERGLLGLAFHPDFGKDPDNPVNDYVYVYYTQKASGGTPPHNRVVRFKANGNVAEGGEDLVFRLDNLRTRGQGSDNHNGGAIHFGTDGKLYVAVGDNKRDRTAQSMNTVLGKILRINPDGSIPTDNPFYTIPEDKNDSIWAKGLRNPYTFAVQPGTGKIHINDVGEQRWEEINVGEAGANYGWPRVERPRKSRFTEPIFAYRHGSGPNTGCAITGGTFYDPPKGVSSSFPDKYLGDYFFADFCSGWIRVLDAGGEEVSPFATGISFPVDLKVSQDGSLYYLSLGSRSVFKIQPSAPATQ